MINTLPGYIKVLGKTYRIEVVKEIPGNDSDVLGLVQYHNLKIYIKEGPAENMVETLLHEVIHAAESALGFDFKETEVQGLSEVLFSIFDFTIRD